MDFNTANDSYLMRLGKDKWDVKNNRITYCDEPLTEAAMQYTIENLKSALELLESEGWCQGEMESADGRFCSSGAITKAQCQEEYYTDRNYRLFPYVIFQAVVGMNIVNWNDDEDRTYEDVASAFKEAIYELGGQS